MRPIATRVGCGGDAATLSEGAGSLDAEELLECILALEQKPMVVIELSAWERHGRFPRSSDGVRREQQSSACGSRSDSRVSVSG